MVCLVAKGSKLNPLRVRKSSLFLKRLRKADPYIYTLPSSCRRQSAVSHRPLQNSSRQTCTAHRLATSSAGFVESFRICLKMLSPLQLLNSNISPSVRSSHQPVKTWILIQFLLYSFFCRADPRSQAHTHEPTHRHTYHYPTHLATHTHPCTLTHSY